MSAGRRSSIGRETAARAVVAAGSLVDRDGPVETLVAGVPAREKRSLAEFAERRRLLKESLPACHQGEATDLRRYFIV